MTGCTETSQETGDKEVAVQTIIYTETGDSRAMTGTIECLVDTIQGTDRKQIIIGNFRRNLEIFITCANFEISLVLSKGLCTVFQTTLNRK